MNFKNLYLASALCVPSLAFAGVPGSLNLTPSATIVKAQSITSSTGTQVVTSIGFSDSSFSYSEKNPQLNSTAFCFVGDINAVCDAINSAAADMIKEYESGAHDLIEVLSCEVGQHSVSAHYLLTDDYDGNLDVTREISDCGNSEEASADFTGRSEVLQAWSNDEGAVEVFSGFYRLSSLVNDKTQSLCYVGQAENVCGVIAKDAADLIEAYQSGDHFYVDVASCKAQSSGSVHVEYTLMNDYEPNEIKKSDIIAPCGN